MINTTTYNPYNPKTTREILIVKEKITAERINELISTDNISEAQRLYSIEQLNEHKKYKEL